MADLQTLGSANADFSADLFKGLSTASPNDNLFFSPASILLALAMTLLGAKGKTESQMMSVLKFNLKNEQVHPMFKQLIDHLQATQGNYELNIANKLYADKSFKILPKFLEKCKNHYGTELQSADFNITSYLSQDAKKWEAEINKWVEDQTKKKITNLIPKGSLGAQTKLVIINAIYFQGKWKTRFDKSFTETMDFFASPNKPVKTSFMSSIIKCGYNKNDKLNSYILELLYIGDSLSFIVILPKSKKTNLAKVQKKLTGKILKDISKGLIYDEVDVYLPKFKLESTPDVKASLQTLGMTNLFSRGKADLSTITEEKGLYVSQFMHKAFIDVNEEGSEAAAATASIVEPASAPMTYKFKADHPFIFLIKDKKSGSVLFMGKFMKP